MRYLLAILESPLLHDTRQADEHIQFGGCNIMSRNTLVSRVFRTIVVLGLSQ